MGRQVRARVQCHGQFSITGKFIRSFEGQLHIAVYFEIKASDNSVLP